MYRVYEYTYISQEIFIQVSLKHIKNPYTFDICL